ncbi:MAG: hypothetical protein H6557_03435 [Lewinellaceae bacterium]|nr:hypothetical protein [Phaeodactylibacter sp.]MCB9035649.1 hypothetical protein [Lewinellaceae bacterium]
MGYSKTLRFIREGRVWLCSFSLFPVFLLLSSPVAAQLGYFNDLPVEYYSVNDGLSDRAVTDMVQSRRGLIWLSTQNGLNRFDGYEFIVFNNHPDNRHQLSDSNIRKLDLDKDGRLVITYRTTYGLFDILDPETLELSTVKLLPEYGIDGFPRLVYVNPEGEILVFSISEEASSIYQYIGNNQFRKVVRIPETHQEPSVAVHLIQLPNGDFLLNDSEMGLRFISASGELVKRFSPRDFIGKDLSGSYPGSAYFMHLDQQCRVWFSLQGQAGVFLYRPDGHLFESVSGLEEGGYYSSIWEDEKGNILLSRSAQAGEALPLQGLVCIRPDGQFFNFDYLLSTSRYILSIFSRDFFRTIFFGIDTGMKIVQNRQSKIDAYLAEDLSQDRRGPVMRGIAGDGERFVYFLREVDHLYELDQLTGFLDTLQLLDPKTGNAIDMACTGSLHLDQEGNLWFYSCQSSTSEGGRLHRYNVETCNLETFEYAYQFNAMTIDRYGIIWLCTQPTNSKGRLLQFDPQVKAFLPYDDKKGNNPLANATPNFITEAKDGNLWVGTENGLYQIAREKGQSKTYRATRGQKDGLASDIVYVIHEDEQGLIWIGTTNGLNILDPKTGKFRHYSRKNGLASNTVCGIVPDSAGNYWISTYNGLSFFDPEREVFRNFYAVDGLTHDEFNRFSYYRDQHGRYYFGGVNGINAFYSQDLLVNEATPPVVLTKITRYNSKQDSTIVEDSHLSGLQELVINPSDSYFTIHFMLPTFTSPRRNQFKTWLEGYDKQWVYQGSNPNLRLNKLPPGQYTLHIMGADANGNWSASELAIPIRMKPAFVQTIWFILLCIVAGSAIAYVIFQNRLEQRLQVERLRTKLSSDLHDELSGLLSGIAMQTDVLQMQAADEKIQERLKQIGDVSRRAMSKMSDVIWSIDSRKDKVEDLLHRMREHADEMLVPLDIVYQMHISKIDRQKKIPVTLRQNLYFIVKEAINNIAKHSSGNKVNITLKNEGPDFVMIIRDNGGPSPGRGKLNGKKTGQGLANLAMRAQRIKADLDIEQGEEGYTVRLRRKKFA